MFIKQKAQAVFENSWTQGGRLPATYQNPVILDLIQDPSTNCDVHAHLPDVFQAYMA